MDSSSNIYKYNLETLSTLDENSTIYYEENKLFVENRMFGRFRYGNNQEKIKEIITVSFYHYYNQLLMQLYKDEDYNNKYNLLKDAITGILNLSNNINLIEEEKKVYDSIRIELNKLLLEIYLEKTNYDDKVIKDKNEKCRYFMNSLIILKNKIKRLVIYVGNFFK
mgnify:FL=1|tara:strand:- start:1333 stop:1830 length:498 start_codon:yes stop_codon:yes gene_type:complete